ncbi:glycosyl-4,4'-diaponeurosporenoate acyltransferase CrtO family protein [Undibacterium macrobrachii]|uniref:Glycosyl-4,4'-diaponeurosporenoate acyltransferase n=1 Tax=Undibacterium macrobrachii TaxID=1119058 RepID=A0ABQ2XKT1_9BURK|nr:hypothetical protein [Undibacterium macrobrachii]GGX21008.1 hypothetical protein GCM10011282_28930 [Undibacterium macrobrachii]
MKRNISLFLIFLASIASVYALVYFMKMESFTFSWALNFLLMMWVSVFIEVQKSTLQSPYFNQKSWERRGKIYTYFGVDVFRKILVLVGWEKLIRKSNPIEKNTQALINLHHQTKKSELGHLLIFLIVLAFNIYVALRFGVFKSVWLLVLNILLNFYPVILQRYNRPRIERAIQLSKRTSVACN